jgi:hypothetical protein
LEAKVQQLEAKICTMQSITAVIDAKKITKRFFECIEKGQKQQVEYLTMVIEDINAVNPSSMLTGLGTAVKGHHKEIVTFLLEQKADVNKHNLLQVQKPSPQKFARPVFWIS